MIIEQGAGIVEKVLMWVCVALMVPLFIVLSQPAWRGKEMVAQMKANCDKIGGVMLETKGLLANSYECSPRYDQGVRR